MISITSKEAITPVAGQPCCDPEPQSVINEDEVRRQAGLLAALADPTRLGIITMLSGLDEPLCVCEIVAHFRLGQPTISHHLRILRETKLVTTEKRGLWVYYSINRRVLDGAASHLDRLVAGLGVRDYGNP